MVSGLVARSLVVAETDQTPARFGFLESMRAYSLEMLEGAAETAAMRRRHAEYFRDRFDEAANDWLRLGDSDWRACYVADIDNVRAALDWSLGVGGDPSIAVALAGATGPLWTKLSLYGEGFRRLNAAVARLRPGMRSVFDTERNPECVLSETAHSTE